jgi:hypothetical protein
LDCAAARLAFRLAQRDLALGKTEVGLGLLQRTLRLLHLRLERPQVEDV